MVVFVNLFICIGLPEFGGGKNRDSQVGGVGVINFTGT
jgi:hypothetical protein